MSNSAEATDSWNYVVVYYPVVYNVAECYAVVNYVFVCELCICM